MTAVKHRPVTRLLYVLLGLAVAACTVGSGTQTQAENNLPATCQANAPDPRACDPADTSKTTVCHIPPGNPANAHTICIGNAAVPAHLQHHGDFVGTCSCGSGSGGSGGGGGGTGSGSGSGSGDGGGGAIF